MLNIQLKDLTFHAFHGLYEEERIIGGKFIVNADITFQETGLIADINETIDYAGAYQIISGKMATPYPLLETLAMEIAEELRDSNRKIKKINISIFKLSPPIVNFKGNVGVTFSKEYQ